MTIRVRRYQPSDLDAVKALNRRLGAAGVGDRVGSEAPDQPAESSGAPLNQEMYVAVDGDAVRGGVWLHEHDFHVGGRTVRAGWLKYPVAESLIDRSFGGVPAALIVSLMRRQPKLMALGMGSAESPIAQLLAALRWAVTEVPLYVTPVRLGRVLGGLPALSRHRIVAPVTRVLAHSGLAALGGAPVNWLRRAAIRRALRGTHVAAEPTFGDWATELWLRCRDQYAFVARRDMDMLNHMYPPASDGWLTRLRVSREGRDVGWVCTLLPDLSERPPHAGFGRLKVGLLADGFGDPRDSLAILGAGMLHLERSGADLVFSNQSHEDWLRALRLLGFVRAKGNFFFAAAPAMSGDLPDSLDRMLLNRGDCDGPRWW